MVITPETVPHVPLLPSTPIIGAASEMRRDFLGTTLRAAREVGDIAGIVATPPPPGLADHVVQRVDTGARVRDPWPSRSLHQGCSLLPGAASDQLPSPHARPRSARRPRRPRCRSNRLSRSASIAQLCWVLARRSWASTTKCRRITTGNLTGAQFQSRYRDVASGGGSAYGGASNVARSGSPSPSTRSCRGPSSPSSSPTACSRYATRPVPGRPPRTDEVLTGKSAAKTEAPPFQSGRCRWDSSVFPSSPRSSGRAVALGLTITSCAWPRREAISASHCQRDKHRQHRGEQHVGPARRPQHQSLVKRQRRGRGGVERGMRRCPPLSPGHQNRQES
jgi:hypothetical protein